MSVRIRMKKMGRTHRHFFRICATDKQDPARRACSGGTRHLRSDDQATSTPVRSSTTSGSTTGSASARSRPTRSPC